MSPDRADDPRAEWDAQAATFDDEPDHGLTDPVYWGKEITDERYLAVSVH